MDQAGAANDMVDGVNMHGVRYVTYEELNNMGNYGKAIDYVDARQYYRVGALKVPFAHEISLGLDHAFSSGWLRLNLVQRTYKDNIVSSVRTWGPDSLVLMTDPSAGMTKEPAGEPMYYQSLTWMNSGQDRIYRGVELSWESHLTDRLTFGGSYNQFQQTGVNDTDYYNYIDLRSTLPGGGGSAAPDGLLSKGLVARAHLTYVVPVGKGNISASIMGAYWTSGLTSITGLNDYNKNEGWYDEDSSSPTGYYYGTGANRHPVYPKNYRANGAETEYKSYYGGLGAYKTGYDQYSVDLKLQAKIPIGLGKTVLITSVQVNDVFNHVLPTSSNAFYDWNQDLDNTTYRGTQGTNVVGRPLAGFGTPWGKSANYENYTSGRNFADFSIGLKF